MKHDKQPRCARRNGSHWHWFQYAYCLFESQKSKGIHSKQRQKLADWWFPQIWGFQCVPVTQSEHRQRADNRCCQNGATNWLVFVHEAVVGEWVGENVGHEMRERLVF